MNRHVEDGMGCAGLVPDVGEVDWAAQYQQAKRAMNLRFQGVFVTHRAVNFDRKTAILPPEARKFIADFDNGLPVTPFSFELDL